MSEWFQRNSSESGDWPLEVIAEAKRGTSIAVVIPARNEIDTIADVVTQISGELTGIIDELIVMDSLSSDDTALEGIKAGAAVHSVADVRPDLGVRKGKGEALWKSQFITAADLLVFIDADLTEWGPHFVTGLLGPLLTRPDVQLVRGYYDRVFDANGAPTLEGGRVTELVARPWIALHRPELIDMVQPLAGEWAIRRSAFERLSIPVGYGVELSTLLDVHALYGMDAIAQVDLGRRAHRHQSLYDLAAMSTEILAVAGRRLAFVPGQLPSGLSRAESSPEFVTLRTMDEDRTWIDRDVAVNERPPAIGVTR